jgi:DNA-binding CsgD family transcriptional regulator
VGNSWTLGADTGRTSLQLLAETDILLHALDELRDHALRELRVALPPHAYDHVARERGISLGVELAGRGARVRVLHLDHVGLACTYAVDLRRLAAAGAEMRTLSHLPTAMLIAGSDTALIPGNPWLPGSGLTLVRGRLPVSTHLMTFEQAWARSSPPVCPAPDGPVPDVLEGREQETLQLLAGGLTDEGIARRTGLSIRTIRRIIAGLMVQLEARSRFQAGVEAARRRWV